MFIYLFVAIFPLLVGALCETKVLRSPAIGEVVTTKYLRRRWCWLLVAAIPMFTLIALRSYHLGADTGVYIKYFEKMVDTPWSKVFYENSIGVNFEIGFVLFEKIVATVTSSPYLYQIIYTTIYLLSVVTFSNQLEKSNFFFLFLFATCGLYTFMFTGVRQCLAMCICLLSYRFIKQRKLIPFLILVLMAFLFHKSAILFVAAYFIYNRKITWYNSLIYATIGIVSYVYIDVIQGWLNNALDYEYEVEETGTGFIFFAVVVVVTAFSYFVILRNKKLTDESRGLLNIGVITLVLWLLRLVTRVAERPSFYFLFFTMGMLCYAVEALNSKEKFIYKMLIAVAFLFLFVYKFLTAFSNMIPYQMFI